MTVAQGADMAYDADGRKLTDTLTGGGSSHALTQYSYDSEGRLTCAARRMDPSDWASLPSDACALTAPAGAFGPDRIMHTLRDANGRATQVQVALGTAEQANERTLAYTNNGTLAHLIDANLNRTTYEYDGHDRLVKTRFPLPALGANSSSTTDYEQLTLDAGGNVTSRRLRDGQSIGYTYDALNRLTNKNLPGTEPDATYAYDLLGRMTSAARNGITNAMTWDALGRRLTETAPQGTTTSIYDLAGRRTRVTLPGATTLYANTAYDLLGNVTVIRENGATSGVGVLATYQYDSLSRRSSVTFGNGVVQAYSYDNASRLATQTNDLAATANDLTQTFAYNPASQITSVTRSNDLYAWTGHANQDDSSTPNGLNQITDICPLGGTCKAVTHDSKGNITAVGSDGYGYSSENFLISGPGGTSLGYDPMGRLYQVTAGATTTSVLYDGLDRVAEYNATNTVARRYVHGPGLDEPIVWYEGGGRTDRRFLTSDERGSVIALTDSSGTLLNINTYDEYGVPQGTNLGRFGYTGQVWVPEIGLWYYKARFYNADDGGRFMQTDPIGYEGGLNWYAYVGNDSINGTDPLGLCATGGGSATGTGRTVRISCPNGVVEVRTGGTSAWRNNNPGNIRSYDFAAAWGAIGANNGFAIFPNEFAGRIALGALLNTSTYRGLTPSQAIARYAPPSENNTAGYQAQVRNALGNTGNRTVGQLSDSEMAALINTIARVEGWGEGGVTYTTLPNGDKKITYPTTLPGSRIVITEEVIIKKKKG